MVFEKEREVVMVCGYMLGIVPVLLIPCTPEDITLSMLKYCEPILNIIPGIIVPEVIDVTLPFVVTLSLDWH